MKICSTLLITRKLQIKSTTRYHLNKSEWLFSKSGKLMSVEKDGDNREAFHSIYDYVHSCIHYRKQYGNSSEKSNKWSDHMVWKSHDGRCKISALKRHLHSVFSLLIYHLKDG